MILTGLPKFVVQRIRGIVFGTNACMSTIFTLEFTRGLLALFVFTMRTFKALLTDTGLIQMFQKVFSADSTIGTEDIAVFGGFTTAYCT